MDDPCFSNMKEYVVQRLVNDKISTEDFSKELKALFPDKSGLSVRSIKRYCTRHGIVRRGSIDDVALQGAVLQSYHQLGPSYGIRPMQGYLRSKGIVASESRVANALKVANPEAYAQRRLTMGRSLNPRVYTAEGFGHKYHLDQNEKLVLYGVTLVIMIDGYSRFIVSHAVMPVKNNILIYTDVFRAGVLKHGLCKQVRTDHGKEFELVHYVQKTLLGKKSCKTRSTQNLPVERQWVDINSRVLYPIKSVLIKLEEEQQLNLSDSLVQNAVSAISCKVVEVGLQRYVASHNSQYIQGRGVPLRLKDTCSQAQIIQEGNIPTSEVALQFASHDGHTYRRPTAYGYDPLQCYAERVAERNRRLFSQVDCNEIYNDLLRGVHQGFLTAINVYLDITTQLDSA